MRKNNIGSENEMVESNARIEDVTPMKRRVIDVTWIDGDLYVLTADTEPATSWIREREFLRVWKNGIISYSAMNDGSWDREFYWRTEVNKQPNNLGYVPFMGRVIDHFRPEPYEPFLLTAEQEAWERMG